MSLKLCAPLTLAAALAALVATAGPARADGVTWHADRAVALGSACRSMGPFADTWFITAGGEISVLFSGMGVDLTPASAANTAVHGCLMRIPLTVDREVRLGALTQRVHWGFAKDHDTELEITAEGTLLGQPTTPIVEYVGPMVQGVQSFVTTQVIDPDIHPPGWICPPEPTDGLLQINLAVAARRDDSGSDISVRMHGEDIEYDVVLEYFFCP